MTMESIFMIVLVAFNVWTIYFYNKLLLEVANNKEEEEKPPIDPMALVGKSLFKVSQLSQSLCLRMTVHSRILQSTRQGFLMNYWMMCLQMSA